MVFSDFLFKHMRARKNLDKNEEEHIEFVNLSDLVERIPHFLLNQDPSFQVLPYCRGRSAQAGAPLEFEPETAPIVEKYLERKYELVASEGEPTAETLRGVRPCLLVSSVRFGRVPKRTDSLFLFAYEFKFSTTT